MSAVFNHAVRWEWLGVNPIRMVRQSAKRTRMPIVLSIDQILANRFRSICDCLRYVELATAESIPNRRGLGIRQSSQQRQTAVLARFALQGVLGTGGQGNWNRRPLRLAHVPAHVCDAPQGERRRREGCARANATRKHLSHSEHLRTSNHSNEARRAEPSCEPVARQE